jgi:hypothetical protein
MNKHKWITLFAGIVLALLLVSNVVAMSSSSYAMNWYVPVTGSGGEISSTNYSINFTVGQTVIGPISSASYHSGLGYWFGSMLDRIIRLPIVFK